jgi:hypothetical protein
MPSKGGTRQEAIDPPGATISDALAEKLIDFIHRGDDPCQVQADSTEEFLVAARRSQGPDRLLLNQGIDLLRKRKSATSLDVNIFSLERTEGKDERGQEPTMK